MRISLNRPDSRNAQSRGLLVKLDAAFAAAERDDDVRVIILAGVGPTFSSGHDMGSRQSVSEREPGPQQHLTYAGYGGTRQVRRFAHAARVAFLLRKHTALAELSQDHNRPGSRSGLRGGPGLKRR
jgi:enoyl-CoA hydratase/carnithine racemase